MYGQLKVHKAQVSFRPIIDNSVVIGAPMQQYLLESLTTILEK